MHIYGFVENRTFLEQFVSMGVPAHFLISGQIQGFFYDGGTSSLSNIWSNPRFFYDGGTSSLSNIWKKTGFLFMIGCSR